METVVIAHNIRSIYNVGSIFRTCDGFGVAKLYLTGYSPSPDLTQHNVNEKTAAAIHKTALGAEQVVPFEYHWEIEEAVECVQTSGFTLLGLESDDRSIPLADYQRPEKVALLLGEEVRGITPELRERCEALVEIPMHGVKESYNVAVASGIALYALTL
jgi:tRNA G18 (ribose-2'-O)-methylase SpoU